MKVDCSMVLQVMRHIINDFVLYTSPKEGMVKVVSVFKMASTMKNLYRIQRSTYTKKN